MPKILSQSGVSLADIYDVEGSIVGVEELDATDVKTVHEMGATILSERLGAQIHILQTIALAQNLTWDIELPSFPDITRLLNLGVVHNTVAGRVEHVTISLNNAFPGDETEVPLFNWEQGVGNDVTKVCRIKLSGSAVLDLLRLAPGEGFTAPTIIMGSRQPQATPRIAFRGSTSGFGAGTVLVTALILVAAPSSVGSGFRNTGLPVPSW